LALIDVGGGSTELLVADAQSLVSFTPESEELLEPNSLSAVPSTPVTTADTAPSTAVPGEDDVSKELTAESKSTFRDTREKSVVTDKSQQPDVSRLLRIAAVS
jgi:exopolyphosphatase/pppGpp-phosphohydrolase